MSLKEILAIVITADGAGAVRGFESVGASAEKNLAKAEGGSARAGAAMQKYGAIAIGVGALMIGAAVKTAQAASQQEQADLKLANTMRGMPQLAGANVGAFLQQAGALQKVTVASDESVEATQALLGQYGLSQEQILKITPLIVDYARKTGKDLVDATGDVGRGLQGTTRALKGHGVEVDKAVFATDKYRAVTEALSRSVGGFAESEGKTMAGQMEILKHQGEEIAESLGRGAIPVLSKMGAGAKAAAEGIESLPGPVKEATGGFLAAGGTALVMGGALSVGVGQLVKMKSAWSAATAEGGKFTGDLKGMAPVAIAGGIAIGVLISRVQQVREEEAKAADEATTKWGALDFSKARKEHDSLVAKQKELANQMNETNAVGRTFSRLGEGVGMDTLEKELDGVNRQLEQTDPAMAEASNRTAALARVTGLTQDAVEGLLGQLKITPDALNNIGDQAKVADVLKRLHDGSLSTAEAQRILTEMQKAQGIQSQKSADQIQEEIDATKKLRDDAMAVVDAQKAATKATDDIAKAERDAAKATEDVGKAQRDAVRAQESVESAERDAVKATEAVVEAKRSEYKAYQAIGTAREAEVESIKRVGEAEHAAVESHEKVQAALDKVTEAEKKLAGIRANAAEQELARAKAAQSVADAQDAVADAEKAAAKARATGSGDDVHKAEEQLARAKLNASQSVIDQHKLAEKQQEDEKNAVKAVADAHKSVADAERDEQKAGEAIVAAKKDVVKAAQSVADAEHDAGKATEAVRDAQYQATQSGKAIRDAHQQVKDAADHVRDAEQQAKDATDHIKDAQDAATKTSIELKDKMDALNIALDANPQLAQRVRDELTKIAQDSPAAAAGIQQIIDALGTPDGGAAPAPAPDAPEQHADAGGLKVGDKAQGQGKVLRGDAQNQDRPPPLAKGGYIAPGESFEVHDDEVATAMAGGGAMVRSKGMAAALGVAQARGASGDLIYIGSIQGSDPHAVVQTLQRKMAFKRLKAVNV